MVYIQIVMQTVWNETYVRLLVREGKEIKAPLTVTDDGYDSYISGCNSGEFRSLSDMHWELHAALNIMYGRIYACVVGHVVYLMLSHPYRLFHILCIEQYQELMMRMIWQMGYLLDYDASRGILCECFGFIRCLLASVIKLFTHIPIQFCYTNLSRLLVDTGFILLTCSVFLCIRVSV